MLSARRIGLVLGPLVAALVYALVDAGPERPGVAPAAAVAAWMSVWWLTEAVPLAATALLPFVLFPLTNVLGAKAAASAFMNPVIFLFLGGFLIAIAMERHGLHRRIALGIISLFGSRPTRVVAGFMLSAAFLSMWISNTATAVMMLPIALAFLSKAEEHYEEKQAQAFGKALLLGLAYACSVGGAATLIGTPPNLALADALTRLFPRAPDMLTFARWFTFGLPLALIMLAVIWTALTRVLFRLGGLAPLAPEIIERERAALGPMSAPERVTLIVAAATALAWLLRADLKLGAITLLGWSSLVPGGEHIHDGMVSIAGALLLFLIPVNGRPPLDSSAFRALPWDIILLIGGGFALAAGFQASGLSASLAEALAGLAELSPVFIVLGIALGMSFTTELTSNTATTQLALPILGALAVGLERHPLLFMLPAALSASMAFMMPAATPPNAIVFGSDRLRIVDMARAGIALNLIGAIVVTALTFLVVAPVLDIDLNSFPDWARPAPGR